MRLDVVVLTLVRIVKSVVTGKAAVTLEWKNTPGEKHKQTKSGIYTHILYIIAEAIHAPAKEDKK